MSSSAAPILAQPLQDSFAGVRRPTDAEGHDMVHAVHIRESLP